MKSKTKHVKQFKQNEKDYNNLFKIERTLEFKTIRTNT